MDGNDSEWGRHGHPAHPDQPAATGDPQWMPEPDDRPQWTPSDRRVPRDDGSWFDKPAPTPRAEQAVPGPDPQWAGLGGGFRPPADRRDAGPATETWSAPLVSPGPGRDDGPVTESFAPVRDEGPAAETWPPVRDGSPAEAWPAQGGAPAWSAQGDTRSGQGDTRSAQGDTRSGQAAGPADGWPAEPETTAAWMPQAGGFQPAAGLAQQGWNDGPARGGDRPAGRDGEQTGWGGQDGGPRLVAAGGATAAGGRSRGVKHPLRLAIFALVLFGLVAGSAAWMSMDKSVTLTVDGEARAVSTHASTVGGVLEDADITVGDHDTLAPAHDAEIGDGGEIVLRRGRLITLTVDGKPKQVWVTATTVEEALSQVGMRQDGLWMSANRSVRLPLEGYQLELRTPKKIMFLADGKKHRLTTTAPTIGAAMTEAGLEVDADDKVSQLAAAPVRAGMTITVTRVQTRTTTVRTTIEYKTVEKKDPDAAVGSREVETEGVEGMQEVTKVETYVDGKLTSSEVAKVTVLTKPVDEVVVVGPEPPPTQPAECKDIPTTGGLNWCGLAKCESGLNPGAYNPAGPYYGLYQFDQGTWNSNGGSGSPANASVAEQTRVAYNLYQARGASPWPVCGRQL